LITVFHHIPKTAGTSLISFLKQQFSYAETCPDRALAVNRFPAPGESPLAAPAEAERVRRFRFFCGHYYFDLTPLVGEEPFRIIFFRDPVQRVISYYYHRRLTQDPTIERALEKGEIGQERAAFIRSTRKMTLRDYLKHDGHGPAQDPLSDHQARVAAAALGADPARPMTPASAAEAASAYRMVGITERFDASLQLLCYERGLKYPGALAALNERGFKSPYDTSDAEAIERIRQRTGADHLIYRAAGKIFMDRYLEMVRAVLKDAGVHDRRREHALSMPFALDSQRMILEALDVRWRRNAPALFEKFPHLVQAPGGTIRLKMSDAICGSGWLGRDGEDLGDPERMSRWSGPGLHSELDFVVRPGKALSVTADIAGVIRDDIVAGLRVLANGRLMDIRLEKWGEDGRLARFAVPADCAEGNGYLSLRFTVPAAVSHHELNGADDRRPKGFRLSSVIIEPAAA
jgi:hypothetical protein